VFQKHSFFVDIQTHLRHCGLDPQSPEISGLEGIPGQARDDGICQLVLKHAEKTVFNSWIFFCKVLDMSSKVPYMRVFT